MPKLLIVPVALAFVLLGWFWLSGGFEQLAAWAAGEQRVFQNRIAQNLRGLRSGEAGAFWLLMSVCFAYGFFHAVGPGHGKVLIGGYGLGRAIPWARLSIISLLSSLGQAVTAVVLVYAGIWIFNMGRTALVGTTEQIMAPVSYGAIALIGAWLIWRGARKSFRQANTHHHHGHHDHHHNHSGDEVCSDCGHRHGPSLAELEQAHSLRDSLALIGGIAVRPCTGALFVLIITWQMGIALAGVAGAFAMALGTATVTVAVGIAAVSLRGGLVSSLSESAALKWVAPMIEVLAGTLIFLIAGGLLLRALS